MNKLGLDLYKKLFLTGKAVEDYATQPVAESEPNISFEAFIKGISFLERIPSFNRQFVLPDESVQDALGVKREDSILSPSEKMEILKYLKNPTIMRLGRFYYVMDLVALQRGDFKLWFISSVALYTRSEGRIFTQEKFMELMQREDFSINTYNELSDEERLEVGNLKDVFAHRYDHPFLNEA